MKQEPTKLDYEAGALFDLAPGMRVWFVGAWLRLGDDCETCMSPYALDTDDPATMGVMFAQFAAASKQAHRGWVFFGHVRAEDLVARMRDLKEDL